MTRDPLQPMDRQGNSKDTTGNSNAIKPAKLSLEEIKLRGLLLARNKDLLQLHKSLVGESLLREDEFWESRQNLIRAQDILIRQKKPPSSAILGSNVKSVNDGQGDVKFVLTPVIIKGILEQNDFVRKAYRDNVPNKMDDKTFFTNYFKSKFADKLATKRSTGAAVEPNILDSYYDEYIANLPKEEEQTSPIDEPAKRFDIELMQADNYNEGPDIGSKQKIAFSKSKDAVALLRKYNNHSASILKQISKATSRPSELNTETDLVDLISKPVPSAVPISIDEGYNNSKELVDRQPTLPMEIKNFDDYKADMEHFLQKFQITSPMYTSILHKYFPSRANESAIPVDQLVAVSFSDIVTLQRNASEILRHFWVNIPMGGSGEKFEKIMRMGHILEQMKTTLMNWMAKGSLLERAFIERIVGNLIRSIEHAIEKMNELGHNQHAQNKKQKVT